MMSSPNAVTKHFSINNDDLETQKSNSGHWENADRSTDHHDRADVAIK